MPDFARNSILSLRPAPLTALLCLALLALLAAPASAGTCSGGPYGGLSCTANWQCPSWCIGGIKHHWTCTSNTDCGGTCAGGVWAGYSCQYNWECSGSYCQLHYCQTYYCQTSLAAADTDSNPPAAVPTSSLDEFLETLATP